MSAYAQSKTANVLFAVHATRRWQADGIVASGAQRTWRGAVPLSLHAGQHQSGTCRMGDDPRTSVVDRWARVHGHDTLFIADGSVHVTYGSVNPALTIMALAFRTAEHVVNSW